MMESFFFHSILPFSECILSIILFALSANLFSLDIVRLFVSKVISMKNGHHSAIRTLDSDITSLQQQMSKLSPMSDFAKYFKLERSLNKLMEERKRIAASQEFNSSVSFLVISIIARLLLLFVSFALALHSADRTILFTIDAKYLYPFNFLLNFPQLFSSNRKDTSTQPVTLFSVSLLFLFVLKERKNTLKEASKKIE